MTSAGLLTDRFAVVERFLACAEPHLAEEALAAARALTDRAASRLRLSGEHTVVALAGASGTGKSSLFNLFAGHEASPVGPLRPTTGEAYACLWNPAGATGLLDWLRVDPTRRFVRDEEVTDGARHANREGDADADARLAGLILVDLPDLGSVAVSHQVESDRLLPLVDLVVWVLDPQKYADQLVHETYLKGFPGLGDVTVFVLNRADTLTAADTDRCVADLRRLVEADGLGQAPVLATSALTGAGVSELRTLLEEAVTGRQVALLRLAGELDEVVRGLRPLVAVEVPVDVIGDAPARDLIDALAAASGVKAVGLTLERGYAYCAVPWRRAGHPYEIPIAPPQEAAVRLAVREFVDVAAAAVPDAWSASVHAAASPSIAEIADQIATELAAAAPGPSRVSRPGWQWDATRAVWWLGLLVAAAAVGWWLAAVVSDTRPTDWFGLPGPLVLGIIALVVVVGIGAAAPVAARRAAGRFRAAVEQRLREVVEAVARERVIDPVRAVLRDYDDARVSVQHLP